MKKKKIIILVIIIVALIVVVGALASQLKNTNNKIDNSNNSISEVEKEKTSQEATVTFNPGEDLKEDEKALANYTLSKTTNCDYPKELNVQKYIVSDNGIGFAYYNGDGGMSQYHAYVATTLDGGKNWIAHGSRSIDESQFAIVGNKILSAYDSQISGPCRIETFDAETFEQKKSIETANLFGKKFNEYQICNIDVKVANNNDTAIVEWYVTEDSEAFEKYAGRTIYKAEFDENLKQIKVIENDQELIKLISQTEIPN